MVDHSSGLAFEYGLQELLDRRAILFLAEG